MTFIENLHIGSKCSIILGGTRHAGFDVDSGIRQGCLLSPQIFAIAADILLRRIQRKISRITCKAFADDIGLVGPDASMLLESLCPIMGEFALPVMVYP